MISNYLFALSMGIVSIILVYLDSLQTKTKANKTTYIKTFMAASIVSLITSEFYKSGCLNSTNSLKSVSGGFNLPGPGRQEILTGNPDF